jgi:hypothetical protein
MAITYPKLKFFIYFCFELQDTHRASKFSLWLKRSNGKLSVQSMLIYYRGFMFLGIEADMLIKHIKKHVPKE